MFGIFKKKTEIEKLEIKYKALLKEAYDLSKTNRSKSDQKTFEAEEISKQIEKLIKKINPKT
ncbi:Lacal_2735 family protein [Flavobacteriaceae bacterium]|nr:Lacal_2735 family protein [Flavobacteriaceae bacterium]